MYNNSDSTEPEHLYAFSISTFPNFTLCMGAKVISGPSDYLPLVQINDRSSPVVCVQYGWVLYAYASSDVASTLHNVGGGGGE